MSRNRELETWAENEELAPHHPPIAAFDGEKAEALASMMLDEHAGARTVIAAMRGVGRLRLSDQDTGESVKQQFLYPRSWERYVDEAVKREGARSKSEYFRMLVAQDMERHGLRLQHS